jgi:hypothetical protein
MPKLTPEQVAFLDRMKIPQKLWPKTCEQAHAFINGYLKMQEEERRRVNASLSAHCIQQCKTLEEADATQAQVKYTLLLWKVFLRGFGIDPLAVEESVHGAFITPCVISRIWMKTGQCPMPITWVDKLHALVAHGDKLDKKIVTDAVTYVVNVRIDTETRQIADDERVAQQLQRE